MAEATSADSILKLMQMFTGKGATTNTTQTQSSSGGTVTSGKTLSQDTINGMLKSAMEGNDGLAAVASGQQSAGVYNSSTNTMLTNDLLSRLTTNIAAQSAPTVTTTSPSSTTSKTTQQVTNPSLGVGGMAGLGLLSLGKGAIDPLMKKLSGALTGEEAAVGGSSAISGGIVDQGNTGMDFVDTNSLAGVLSASGEGATSMADALTPSSDLASSAGDAFSDWWSSNDYSSVADSVDSGLDAIDAVSGSDAGSSFFDTIKGWFS